MYQYIDAKTVFLNRLRKYMLDTSIVNAIEGYNVFQQLMKSGRHPMSATTTPTFTHAVLDLDDPVPHE